jgi:hypothetical protein
LGTAPLQLTFEYSWEGKGISTITPRPPKPAEIIKYCEPVPAQMWMVTTKTAIEQCPLDLQENLEEK